MGKEHDLRTWLNVIDWVRKNRPEILEEALEAVGSKAKALPAARTTPVVQPSNKVEKQAVLVTENQRLGLFIKAYADAYKGRYGAKARPACLDDGKTRGQMLRFLKGRQLDQAVNLIQAYLQMSDKWFLTKYHDFTTFAENINKVGLALVEGRPEPGKKTWQDIVNEKEVSNGPEPIRSRDKAITESVAECLPE